MDPARDAEPAPRGSGRGTAGFCAAPQSIIHAPPAAWSSSGSRAGRAAQLPPPRAAGVPAPIPFVTVGAGWEVAELMFCPMPGCPQGLTGDQPCPPWPQGTQVRNPKQADYSSWFPGQSTPCSRDRAVRDRSDPQLVPGVPRDCWESLNRRGRGPCWCRSFSALLGSSFHLPGSYSTASEARPALKRGHDADTPAPALSRPQCSHSGCSTAELLVSPLGLGTLRCRGMLSRAGRGARLPRSQRLGGDRGSPRQQEKELGLCLSGLCPAPISLPRPGSHRLANLHSAGAAGSGSLRLQRTHGPCEGQPDAGSCGRSPSPLPAAGRSRSVLEGSQPSPGEGGVGRRGGGSQPAGPLSASAGCRNGGLGGGGGGQRARSALGLTLTPPAGRSRSAKSRKRLSAA